MGQIQPALAEPALAVLPEVAAGAAVASSTSALVHNASLELVHLGRVTGESRKCDAIDDRHLFEKTDVTELKANFRQDAISCEGPKQFVYNDG